MWISELTVHSTILPIYRLSLLCCLFTECFCCVVYLQIVFDGGLLNPGGTVLVDNAFYFGAGYKPSAGDNPTKQFAKAVSSDPSLHTVS